MFVIYSFIFVLVVLSNLMLYLSLVNIPQLIPFSLLPPANEVAKVMSSVMYRTLAPPPHVFKHVQVRPYCGWLASDWLASCSFQQNKYQGVNNHIGGSLNLTWREPMLSYYSEVKVD